MNCLETDIFAVSCGEFNPVMKPKVSFYGIKKLGTKTEQNLS
jgi:hypothetical protein